MPSLRNAARRLSDAMGPVGRFLGEVARSLYPDSYHEFSERSVSYVITYFLTLVAVSTLVLGIVFIPFLVRFPDSVNATFSKFETLRLVPEFKTREPVVLSYGTWDKRVDTSAPMNLSAAAPSDAMIVDEKSFAVKQPRCLLFPLSCTFREPEQQYVTRNISDYSDLLRQRERVIPALWAGVLYLVPLALIVLFIAFSAKFFAIALVVTVVGGVATKILRAKISVAHVFKLAIYAMTAPVAVGIVNLGIGAETYFIPWIIFLAYFLLGMYLSGGDDDADRVANPFQKSK